jgi:hypothetical protein
MQQFIHSLSKNIVFTLFCIVNCTVRRVEFEYGMKMDKLLQIV